MTRPNQSSGAWTHAAAATLLIAAPLVAFLATNQYPLARPEVGILLAACAPAGVLLGFATAQRPAAAALLFGAGLALAIDLTFGLGRSNLALMVLALTCLVVSTILRRHIALVVGAASFAFLAATILAPGTVAGQRTGGSLGVGTQPADGKHLPVLVHLILDEHIGIDGLPKEFAESAEMERWLTDTYLRQGFRVYAGAYSEYFETRNSIANLLNLTSEGREWAHLAEGKTRPYVLTDSAYFRHLSSLGYRLHVYQSDHLDYCRVPAVSYAACFRYKGNSIGSLLPTSLPTLERAHFILNSFMAASTYLDRLRAKYAELGPSLGPAVLPRLDHAVSRVGPLAVLPVLGELERDLASASRGHAYFAHLLIPHHPYVLDESCRVREEVEQWLYNLASKRRGAPTNTATTRAERYRNYFAQIRCQQALLDRVFAAMKDAGVWRDALVIIHGDHGSRIVRHLPVARNAALLTQADFGDAFSTLFAARIPGREPFVVHDSRPLQELLSEALQLPLDTLSRKVYLRSDDGKALSPSSLSLFRSAGDR
jgi:hypothetical protein